DSNNDNGVRSEDDAPDRENCESAHATSVVRHCDDFAPTQPHHSSDNVQGRLEVDELKGIGEKEVTNEIIYLWQSCRLEISIGLGSIGAPPLGQTALRLLCNTICSGDQTDLTNAISSENLLCPQESKARFGVFLQLSAAHISLLQTMDGVMHVISAGTGVRLGLGPHAAAGAGGRNATFTSGCRGTVFRAERAWISRILRMNSKFKSNCMQQSEPNLTLQRSRHILFQAIVDQVTSLHGLLQVLGQESEEQSAYAEWNEFVRDLQHSLRSILPNGRNTPMLTLSQLSSWISRIGSLLSYILSGYLSSGGLGHLFEDPCIEMVQQSTQMAIERVAFLSSVFPLTVMFQKEQSKQDPNRVETTETPLGWAENTEGNELTQSQRQHGKRQAKNIIERLHSIMGTARITLWAFENSFSNCSNATFLCGEGDEYDCTHTMQKSFLECIDENENVSPDIWWSEFKDLISQSWASVTEFEVKYFVKSNEDNSKDGSVVSEQNAEPSNKAVSDHCFEFVSNIPSKLAGGNNRTDEQYTEKTLVFSGSGTQNKTRQMPKNGSKLDNVVPSKPAFNAIDQNSLLRDLEKTLKIMKLAEEHEVVAGDQDDMTEPNQNELFQFSGGLKSIDDSVRPATVDKSKQKGIGNSQPFFLGVSGDLLSELSSVVAENLSKVEKINSDSNVAYQETDD
ncbi:hypothetical protein ACHAXS_007700, partial [Conticribra weissflogii]